MADPMSPEQRVDEIFTKFTQVRDAMRKRLAAMQSLVSQAGVAGGEVGGSSGVGIVALEDMIRAKKAEISAHKAAGGSDVAYYSKLSNLQDQALELQDKMLALICPLLIQGAETGGASSRGASGKAVDDDVDPTLTRKERASSKGKIRRGGVSAESTNDDDMPFEKKNFPKSAEASERLKSAVSKNILFSHLEAEELDDVVAAFFQTTHKVDPQHHLFVFSREF